ncbi:MAG TPA: COX15/CtaA family protein [Egicoccus sp.]|nr:COX15/CtaA family protein [Egicoccus sp.]HSK23988.1 COX15/CtaA family protein [Egicoccus sp.]
MDRRRANAGAMAAPTDRLRGVRRLAAVTAAGTLVLIAMGGAVRATDSGLACPDWPACYGKWIPPADVNMWFEHSHRLWAGVIGLAVAWLTAWTLLRFRDRPALWRLSLAALVLVVAQAALGAAVVLLHLRAGLVTSHLGMSLVVVACLIVLTALARPEGATPSPTAGGERVGRWAAGVAGLVFLQALLGGQATGRGAAYVYNAVPFWLADQAWTGNVREWLHVTHRAGGYLVATTVVAFAVAVHRRARTDATVPAWAPKLAKLGVALVLAQVGLGLANVLTRAGALSATGHLSVASWLWATFVVMAVRGLAGSAHGGRARRAGSADADARPGSDDGPGNPRSIAEEVNA